MDLVEIGLDELDWIPVAEDRYRWRALANSVMNLWIPQNAGKRGAVELVAFRVAQFHRVSM
jgi:hypothetical protein